MEYSIGCMRKCLIGINVVLMVFGVILVILGAHATTKHGMTYMSTAGGLVATGVILVGLGGLAILGAVTYKPLPLTAYIFFTGVIFVLQLALSIVLLCMSGDQQVTLVHKRWMTAGWMERHKAEATFGCCGYLFTNVSCAAACDASCGGYDECSSGPCVECAQAIYEWVEYACGLLGGMGLAISILQAIALYLAYKFRYHFLPRYHDASGEHQYIADGL